MQVFPTEPSPTITHLIDIFSSILLKRMMIFFINLIKNYNFINIYFEIEYSQIGSFQVNIRTIIKIINFKKITFKQTPAL